MTKSDTFPKGKRLKRRDSSLETLFEKKERNGAMPSPYQELLMAAIRCHNRSHDFADISLLFTEEERVDVEQLLLENIRGQ
jgi:hypothetical protein